MYIILLFLKSGLAHGGYLGPADMSLGNADLIKPDPSMLQSGEDSLLGAMTSGVVDEEDILSPTNHIPKGPSPEPKIEDSECHRSQSAMYVYYRGQNVTIYDLLSHVTIHKNTETFQYHNT